ncbi:ABC transporter permease [Salibacterium aidingense]|uniref:ABC transporter permease n=1 Tax=Salibacterium aidingense TaxID=384933 RepID=UPI003BEBCA6A
MIMVRLQCKAEILKILRNPYFVFWSLVMPIVFYFIFTRIVNTNAPDEKLWQAHYLMSMTTFSVMGSAMMTLGLRMVQERTQGWSTFMKVTPLPDSIYFLAQMTAQTVIHLFSIIVIFIAGMLINGVSLAPQEWIMCGFWILLGSAPFLAIGTLVGAMQKVETAAGVTNILYLLLALAGGLWMPLEMLPDMMQAVGKWLPSYSLGNGAWEIIRGNFPEGKNVVILLTYFVLFMLLSKYVRRKQEAV